MDVYGSTYFQPGRWCNIFVMKLHFNFTILMRNDVTWYSGHDDPASYDSLVCRDFIRLIQDI